MEPQKLLSVIILTLNEAANLPDCLASLQGLDCDVYVVDSGSKDGTQEIAAQAGATVVSHPFDDYSAQRNWSQRSLDLRTDWVLHLDADERLTPKLVAEIGNALRSSNCNVDGFLLRRRTVFMGRWIKHGGHYPSYQLRLFRKDRGRCECRLYDQHFLVEGPVDALSNDYIDIVTSSLDEWTVRHLRWAGVEASEMMQRAGIIDRLRPRLQGDPRERRRWLRERVYARSPVYIRALAYFLYRYVIRLGFLDGKQGFVFHLLQGLWYRVVIDVNLDELRRRVSATGGASEHEPNLGSGKEACPGSSGLPFH